MCGIELLKHPFGVCDFYYGPFPRALPWAGIKRPFGAGNIPQFLTPKGCFIPAQGNALGKDVPKKIKALKGRFNLKDAPCLTTSVMCEIEEGAA